MFFWLNIYLNFHLDFRSSLMEKLWNLGVSQLMLEDGMCRSAWNKPLIPRLWVDLVTYFVKEVDIKFI